MELQKSGQCQGILLSVRKIKKKWDRSQGNVQMSGNFEILSRKFTQFAVVLVLGSLNVRVVPLCFFSFEILFTNIFFNCNRN